jgi:hypothetical protein
MTEQTSQPEVKTPPEEAVEEKSLFDFESMLQGLAGKKLSTLEAIMLMDYMDRKEEREFRRTQLLQQMSNRQPQITAEDIAKIVRQHVEEAVGKLGLNQPQQAQPEMPDWAKEIQAQMKFIMDRLNKEEEEKKTQELISKVQQPVFKEIEKTITRLNELEKRLEEIKQPTQAQTDTLQEIKRLRETLETIKETAKAMGLKEESSSQSTSTSFEGIPVHGSVPAYALAIPKIIESVFNTIEKRAEAWLKSTPAGSSERILVLPEKPQPQPSFTATNKLLELPPLPPTTPTPAPPPPEVVHIKLEPEPSPEPASEPEKKEVKVEAEKPKEYKCKICGEAFPSLWQLGSHTRWKHKKKEGETERQEKSASTTPTQSSQSSEKP